MPFNSYCNESVNIYLLSSQYLFDLEVEYPSCGQLYPSWFIMRFQYLATLLPLISALQLPHLPTAQDALSAANALLQPIKQASHTLGYASDVTLASIPGDEHMVFTSAKHPVSHLTLSMGLRLIKCRITG